MYEKVLLDCEKTVWTQDRSLVNKLMEALRSVRGTLADMQNPNPEILAELERAIPTLTGEESDADIIKKRLLSIKSLLVDIVSNGG